MTSPQLPYLFNIMVLLPIAVPTIFRWYPTDQGKFAESAGWRILVGAMWTAILILSVFGLRSPERFSPLLVMQVIYKSIWIGAYALPRLLRGRAAEIPWGIAGTFLVIMVGYPLVIPWAALSEP